MLISVERMASPPVRKPMSTRCAAIRLRVRRPADTSSTIVTAICVTTRPSRIVQRRPAACVADTSLFSSFTRFGRVALSAGARPATSAATIVTTAVNSSTRPSILSAKDSGIGIGRLIEVAIRVIVQASATPAAAPSADITTLSASSC